jgi:hypothetical protein
MDNKDIEITFEPTPKQHLIFEHFDDDLTTEILYGGSAGSAKSYGICALIIIKCLQHPGIRVGLARNELTTLKKTTIVSFFEVSSAWGLKPEVHFTYNSTAGIIKFTNGSEVILFELSYKPSDPNYTRLGGHLLTFGCVDELAEVDEQGFNIFKTRLGRWKNDEFGIKPIVVSTCNPSKNWIYREYYKAYKEERLKPYQSFIQALPTDNPYIPQSYLDNLKKLPFAERERLLYGNWEFDDNPNALLTQEQILNIWDNVPVFDIRTRSENRFISADIAFTSDKMVIMVWDGLTIVDLIVSPNGNIEEFILNLAIKYGVPNNHITYDSDGVGKFLTTRLRNARPIVNNAAPIGKENYKNLKTQLYFKLCDEIKANKVKVVSELYRNEIMEELQLIEHKPTDIVGKIEMVDKGDVKRNLGRSPDFSDAMAYRMIFEVNPARFTVIATARR